MKTRWISLAVLSAAAVLGVVPAGHAAVQVSPNHRLAADKAPFRGQDQPGLAVNPGNPNHVVAVNANYLDSDCETSVSTDGGTTWSPPVSLRPPAGQDFRQWCHSTVGTNQIVEFGSGNTVYTAVSAQRGDTAGFLEDATALLYKSTDGGNTWQEGIVAMAGGPGGLDPNATQGPAFYRPSIGVDRGAGTGGQDRIHIVARDLRAVANGLCPNLTNPCRPIRYAVSENGGQTFSATERLSPAGANIEDFPSKPVVNPDHSVTVAWRPSAVTAPIQAIKRSPQGTWGNPVDVTQVVNTGTAVTSHVSGALSSSGTYPRMDVNRSNGRLYMVYTQGPGGPNPPAGGYQGADHWMANALQVWFQRSSDGGLTWSTPKRISEATSFPGARTHQTRHANISVSPNGRINVVWHDRRHWYQGPGERNCRHSHIFCEDIRLGDTYYSYSTDNGDSFAKPIRINDRSHNNEVGYDTRPSGYWWFGPQVVTVGNDQKALVAWMDSREGNWENDNEDIYLAKVDFNASGAAPKTFVNAADAISRSVALSKVGYRGGPEGALVGGPRDPANPPGCSATPPTAICSNGPATRNASSVVIANQGDVPSALAGTVLGRANPGPVLLSSAGGLTAAVKAEVTRMKPARAFVIGETGDLSDLVRTDVATAAGIPLASVVRISGASDAARAADIASRMDARSQAEKDTNVPAFDAAVIANPDSPDAAAVAGLAAARRLPVLYVGPDSVPAVTQQALADLDIDQTLVIGGASVVGAGVLGQLPSPKRLGGADQYGTSDAVVAESISRGLPTNVAYVADGAKPIDGVLQGGVAARATGLVVLARAPLYLTAAGRADNVGAGPLTRLFVAGAAAPGAPGPPARRTYPGPGTGSGALAAFAGCPSLTANVLRGTAASNTIRGTARGDRIFAGAGNDSVDALAGNDCVDLEAGTDRAQGRGGNDLILGGRGRDRLSGGSGKDKLRGGGSADLINGGGGNDTLTGSGGKDRISGGSGKDRVSSGSGNDRVSTRDRSRDRVNCGSGKRDVAIVDRRDRVRRNCERVRRSRR